LIDADMKLVAEKQTPAVSLARPVGIVTGAAGVLERLGPTRGFLSNFFGCPDLETVRAFHVCRLRRGAQPALQTAWIDLSRTSSVQRPSRLDPQQRCGAVAGNGCHVPELPTCGPSRWTGPVRVYSPS